MLNVPVCSMCTVSPIPPQHCAPPLSLSYSVTMRRRRRMKQRMMMSRRKKKRRRKRMRRRKKMRKMPQYEIWM